jgi:hypothetical protein
MSLVTERQGLLATLARWNVDGHLDGILPLLPDAQLRELLILLDEVYTLGYGYAGGELVDPKEADTPELVHTSGPSASSSRKP